MTTLLDILELMKVKDERIRKDVNAFASTMVSNLFKPLLKRDFRIDLIELGWTTYQKELKKLGYRVYDAMDYEHMVEMPQKKKFDFDPSGKFFERYFGITSLEGKIEIPHQTKGDLVTIGLGKSLIENSAYIVIASDAARMLGRIKAVKGNEQVIKPILYALIREYIEILIPNNLVYSR